MNIRKIFIASMLLILCLIPIFVRDPYILNIFILVFIWSVVVSAWDLITGYAGIFSFGQIAFFVNGAYISGMMTKYLGISPWYGILIGGILTAVVGIIIGLPCLRIKGVYISLVTYGLHLVLPTLILRGAKFGTGGSGGLVEIPSLQIGSYLFNSLDKIPWYYTSFAIFILSIYLIYYKVLGSALGLAFRALRDSEVFAKSLGVNEYKYKIIAFSISAFFTGLVGAFYAHYVGSISHRLLGIDFFLLVMVMLTFGGIGRYPGAIVGAFIITFVNEFLRCVDEIRLIILGIIVVITIIAMPEGAVSIVEYFKKLIVNKEREQFNKSG